MVSGTAPYWRTVPSGNLGMFVIPPLQDLMRQSVAVINDLEGGRDTPHNNYGHHYSSIDVVRKARVMDQNPEPDPSQGTPARVLGPF